MKLVTIIIPTYNVENYILATLNSVIEQTYQNIEIIVVDDGSSDSTTQKVTELGDSRIKLFCKKNGGPNSAREFGVAKSSGELVVFLDADDFFAKNTSLEYMIKNHGQNVCTSFNFKPFYDDTRKGFIKYSIFNKLRLLIPFTRKLLFYNWYLWAKVFNADFLKTCKWNNLSIGEDRQFFIDNEITNYKIINKNVVKYRVRKSSAMRTK